MTESWHSCEPVRYRTRDFAADVAAFADALCESADHALHWEEPERFAADVVPFAGSLTGEGRRS